MSVAELVGHLESLGVSLWEESGSLRFRAPSGVMTGERKSALREQKEAVLSYLRQEAAAARAVPDAAARYEPFPLTDVQGAYLLGRRDSFAYGGVACHAYGELAFDDLDPPRLEEAWRALVRRHDMLRAVVDLDGSQRVLPETPDYRIAVADLRGASPGRVQEAIDAVRAALDHRIHAPDVWPLFELRVTRSGAGAILHVSIDFLIADYVSIHLVLAELQQLYADPACHLPPLDITYRDYLLAERRLRSGAGHRRDREYWWRRLEALPPAPELPLAPAPASGPVRFRRWSMTLPRAEWADLQRRAAGSGLTASGAILAAYADVVGRWSRRPSFTLDVTLLQRLPLHPQVDRLVGDFTSVDLLAVEPDVTSPFRARAHALQAQLWEDLDHRLCSGIEVIREIGRRRGAGAALMPIVYTSAIGLARSDERSPDDTTGGTFVYGISQTPQVWIDCQVMERRGELSVNWDVREGVFPDGLVDAMFDTFADLVRRLAVEDEVWGSAAAVDLPEPQRRRRRAVNDTAAPVPKTLLHEGLVAQALRTPTRVAVIAHDLTLTYGELLDRALGVCAVLRKVGCRPGAVVPVALDKGAEQVVAVVGTLLAGAAYLPIDPEQPASRRRLMLAGAKVSCTLTQSSRADDGWPAEGVAIAVDQVAPAPMPPLPERSADPGDLAYVIYTSGSSGVPKGVMIAHRSAVNTIADLNDRFGVGPDDRVLGLASLGFDLSVYDIFGPLARGGCLVLPDPARRGDPSHWAQLVAEHGVTLWNSVPAQAQMLVEYLASEPSRALPSLRLAWLSGDWIPVTLPGQLRERLPQMEIVSLGGATEAAIWSIHYPIGDVPPHWRSIPYGKPLANQTVHVLDPALRPCPDWTTGELYIGGVGVAAGYFEDAAKTAERFIEHPASGERLYRTGDLGRSLPDGNIELLGREDFQVKIRGHRIELGEIEATLQLHPAVAQAVAIVDRSRPTEPRLAAFAETARQAGAGDRGTAEPARVAEAAASAVAGISQRDCGQVVELARQLDETALVSMLYALEQQGLFATPEATHSLEEILATARVAAKHHRLIRRWLKALDSRGLVESTGTPRRYRSRMFVEATQVAEAWRRVDDLQPALNRRTELIDYFRLASRRLPELMRGEVDPIHLLFPEGRVEIHEVAYNDNLLSKYLNTLVTAAVREIVNGRSAAGPVRLLEAGAGVGGTSMELIPALAGSNVEYLFTDVSQFFINNAQQRYGAFPWVRYGLFDINTDYRPQGLAPNSLDVIVCANVLHYAVDARRVLQRFRELLAPGGWLVFIEMVRDNYQILTSMEFLFDATVTDFEDVRQGLDETFIGRDAWQALIAGAGGELGMCLPRPDDLLAQVGFHVFAARFKADRTATSGAELRAFLSERLPEYMVPAQVQVVDALPLTGNGKIDRAALGSWLPAAAAGQAPHAPGAEPSTDLERRLVRLWVRVIGAPRIGRDESFFAAGGDSLLAAQLVGLIREEIPEAKGLFFEQLLRLLLEDPTIASLAARIEAPAETADASGRPGASPLLRLAEGTGTLRVLVHDASGTLASYEALVPTLAAQGPLAGLAVGSLDDYLSWQPSVLIEQMAAEYAGRLKADGHDRVHVVGYHMGGALAAEVARRLLEAGIVVDELALIADTCVTCLIEDDLLVEYLFARGAGIDPMRLGFPREAALAESVRAIRDDAGRIPDGRLASLAGTAEQEGVAWCFRRLAALPPAERAAAIGSAVARAGTPPPAIGQVTALLDLFRHSMRGLALHRPEPYSGDVTLLCPREESAILRALGAGGAEVWGRLCLGELSSVEVPGNAWSCVRGPDGAALADLVAARSHAGSAV